MLYGTAQAGPNAPPNQGLNVTSLEPGDTITILTGSETLAQNTASVSFSRGYSPAAMDNGVTFNLRSMPASSTMDVQVAAADVAGYYTTVATLSPDSNGNAAFTDTGRSPFYRLMASAATASTGTIATATR